MRSFIFCVSVIGAVLFITAFGASYAKPTLVESLFREAIRHEVEKRVGEKLASIDDRRIVEILNRTIAVEINKVRNLKELVRKRVAAELDKMRDPTCECRTIDKGTSEMVDKAVSLFYDWSIVRLEEFNKRLTILIRTKYMEAVESLTREFRIFTGANAVVFALLGLTTYLRREAGLQLILPAIVLIGAGCIVGGFYLFGQDWLHTIVFSTYIGLGYFAYLSVALAFMLDVFYNSGRVSAAIIRGVLDVINAAETIG